jgi:hypothetical protein
MTPLTRTISALNNSLLRQQAEPCSQSPDLGTCSHAGNRGPIPICAALLAVVCLSAFLFNASAAHAWYVDAYSKATCPRGASDPLGVQFYGPRSGTPNTADQIAFHVGWSATDGWFQSFQRLWFYFPQQGENYCDVNDTERASQFGYKNSRFHIRLWHIPGDPLGTLGTPHHEDWIASCGSHGNHAVDENSSRLGSGFDRGRRALVGHFEDAGHKVVHKNWGNTRNFKQCDGEWAGSNGNGAVIRIGHTAHH